MKKLWYAACLLLLFSCDKDSCETDGSVFAGNLSKRFTMSLAGFDEQKSGLLRETGVSYEEYIAWSVDSAWSLAPGSQEGLKKLRKALPSPDAGTLLQKIIPLEDVPVYMNNLYGGTVGGFVSVAADVKKVATLFDVFWGLRLDYEGTKFRENGGGYAVIRFYSDAAPTLGIPFCPELGGEQAHQWPNTGGGFTASKLGKGGYAEYKFGGYSAPRNGAELYEVTPQGREILRAVYVDGKGWTTHEIGAMARNLPGDEIRNGVYTAAEGRKTFITTYAMYEGNRYIVRGKTGERYHLTTQIPYEGAPLEIVEKGIYGIETDTVEKIWEESFPVR